ncbi:MAG: M61 family metallopeptidase [Prochlorotrichaceae cyanobacterium]
MKIHYQVSMPQPSTHLFEVELRWVDGADTPESVTFALPVWTPGSYLVREYSRHLQNLKVWAGGTLLPSHQVEKIAKNRWQVEGVVPATLRVSYQVLATELTVRTNHLDETHGYFNPAALLLFVEGYETCAHQVTIVPPYPHWQIATPLPPVSQNPYTVEAANYDLLVDSPFEVGEQQCFDFTVLDKPHRLVIWGKGNYEPQQLIEDIHRLIETEAALFGDLPYDRYLFLMHLSGSGYGGLEHRDSCSLLCPRSAFRQTQSYTTVLNLIAHEFFHLWNVKRLRPLGLETFDYQRENYTPSLWFCEGVTSYYDLLIPLQAGLYDDQTFLSLLGKDLSRWFNTPGRQVQPLRESSFDAWIKLYRRDAHSDNHQVSYYLKGAIVTLILDLQIRARHHNRRSFDDVLRSLWQEFGKPERGFSEADLERTILQVGEWEQPAAAEFIERYRQYLDSTEELPLAEVLAPFGLALVPVESNQPFSGVTLQTSNGRTLIRTVLANSPAQEAGLEPEDELLAIDGMQVNSSEEALALLENYAPGETIAVAVFHQNFLCTRSVTLGKPQPSQYEVRPVPDPTPEQILLYNGWLGNDR